jgi:hypothetical protein
MYVVEGSHSPLQRLTASFQDLSENELKTEFYKPDPLMAYNDHISCVI